jgi:hypothetical protein
MSTQCCVCHDRIVPMASVIQLCIGRYYRPFITPTMEEILGNWHEHHFDRGLIHPQRQPYGCTFCARKIESHATVLYAVRGRQPEPWWVRPYDRGYEMQFIACPKCSENRALRRVLDQAATVDSLQTERRYRTVAGGQYGR